MFMAIHENLNGSILLQITKNLQLDNIESYIHTIFIGKQSIYSIFLVLSQILLYQSGTPPPKKRMDPEKDVE